MKEYFEQTEFQVHESFRDASHRNTQIEHKAIHTQTERLEIVLGEAAVSKFDRSVELTQLAASHLLDDGETGDSVGLQRMAAHYDSFST